MGWIKIDDNIFSNKKILPLSKDAKLFHLAGLCYSGANLSDGVIPDEAVRIVAAQAGVSSANKLIVELQSAGLWKPHERGYEIHDYLKHNTSLAEVEAKREAARIRAEKRRKGEHKTNNEESSQEVRANNSGTSQNVRMPETETETETETEVEIEGIGADAPTPKKPSKPLPENGPAQKIVKAYCEAVGIEKPANYRKSAGQAQQISDAGITADEIPRVVEWLNAQAWVKSGVDLGLILNQADKWRASQRGSLTIVSQGEEPPSGLIGPALAEWRKKQWMRQNPEDAAKFIRENPEKARELGMVAS